MKSISVSVNGGSWTCDAQFPECRECEHKGSLSKPSNCQMAPHFLLLAKESASLGRTEGRRVLLYDA